MDERVFRPLGMHSTVPDYADRVLPGRATCYYLRGEELTEAGPVDNSYKWAGGGFLSTATDLVRFGSAHLAPGFLAADSLALLFTSQRTTSGEATGYGIGWSVRDAGTEDAEYSHTGGSVGGTTALLVHPASGLVVALTTNLSNGPVSMARARELRRAFAER
jgi:CubicO group peptidase (beta-lactamase class C family)